MISLLGSLLGFGSSLVGPVLETWNKSSDQKHELAMLHAQAEVQSKIQDQKLEATIVEADMAEIVPASPTPLDPDGTSGGSDSMCSTDIGGTSPASGIR